MNRPSISRQTNRRPSVHKMNRRQAPHRFSRRTQRFNHEPPILVALPVQAIQATQEVAGAMAGHDAHLAVPEAPPSGRMDLPALVRSPFFRAGLQPTQAHSAQEA